jgi:uncharacterized membrane protein (UPF0127 family)
MIYVKNDAHFGRWTKHALSALALLSCGLASVPSSAQTPAPAAASAAEQPQRLQAITLGAGMHNIHAELAMTPEQRQKGLMYRRDLATHEGMLFIFEQPQPQCFWMRNTPTPLSIAFVADDGSIVNLADMTPFDEKSHCSNQPVRYVLEMNQGWFAKRGIKAGFKLTGVPFKP